MTALVLLSDMLDNFALLPYSLSKYRGDSTLCACQFKFIDKPTVNCMAAFIVFFLSSHSFTSDNHFFIFILLMMIIL